MNDRTENQTEPNQGQCEICGYWDSSLEEGVCPDCRNRLKLDDPKELQSDIQQDLKTPAYTRELALWVNNVIGPLVQLPSVAIVEDIISEALFRVAHNVRSGVAVDLEHIGTFQVKDPGAEQLTVLFEPKEYLQKPISQPLVVNPSKQEEPVYEQAS